MTELVECERTHDVWLQTLQNEIRNGTLSPTNHAFLHGAETDVPGSWNGQGLDCGCATCHALMTGKATPAKIREGERGACKRERASKVRVVDAGARPSHDFGRAKAIFATSAIKYHVNKLRAKDWAAAAGQQLHYAIAKDCISSAALREKPDLAKEKLAWLQRHDQDCGSLYGVLPLCVGLPVTATDHLDRRRGIPRGCPGEVVGWAWPKEASDLKSQEKTKIWNELPGCIMVRFHTKDTWRVEGVLEDNVYPVPAQKKPWYLDLSLIHI